MTKTLKQQTQPSPSLFYLQILYMEGYTTSRQSADPQRELSCRQLSLIKWSLEVGVLVLRTCYTLGCLHGSCGQEKA